MTHETINGIPIIGAKPKPKGTMVHPAQAVAQMSEGFLTVMKFLQLHGMPKDVMIEAMRIGEANGLCRRIEGQNTDGTVFMQYINPYADMVKNLPPLTAKLADKEG